MQQEQHSAHSSIEDAQIASDFPTTKIISAGAHCCDVNKPRFPALLKKKGALSMFQMHCMWFCGMTSTYVYD
jgi:hypothetical protein